MTGDTLPLIFAATALFGGLGGLVRYLRRQHRRQRSNLIHDLLAGIILGGLAPMLVVSVPIVAFSAGLSWPEFAETLGNWGLLKLRKDYGEGS